MTILFLPRLSAALVLLFSPIIVHGHGYLKTPRSRNYVAYMDGVWSGGTATTPEKESEPQSANRKAATATCGVIAGSRDYDYPKNVFGGALAPKPQACYQTGQIIDLEVTLTAHHKGHFEFKMCPISPGVATTQACFDANPLTFVTDTMYGANLDPNYPERAYIPDAAAGYTFSYKYMLPAGLSGDLVLLQWHYVTANSCIPEGYYEYTWPVGTYWSGPNPSNMATCGPLPLDGNGAPEQFWNCAEIRVASDCAGVMPSLQPVTSKPSSIPTSLKPTLKPTSLMPTEVTQIISSPTTKPVAQVTSSPTMKPTSLKPTSIPTFSTVVTNPMCSPETNQCGPTKTCESAGFPGYCCSQYGWCGLVDVSAPDGGAYCGTCCQNGPCFNALVVPTPPSPTPPTPTAPSGDNYSATHGEDSRLIAYVGNWQTCPTASQVDAYSHIVIAFAVSYTWAANKNNCDAQCNIASSVPICNNMNNQALVDTWRAAGKKVILSFGGAGMGGSWDGDANNCWDYCFGKEEQLATNLVTIIQNQKLDGIDIDYEYCYDIAGKQSGRCPQRSSLYTDVKAQTFLNDLTFKLRAKLNALQLTNGYNSGRYEVTHAPMDSDLTPSTSKYFQILKARSEDLDFIMPQFYNGVTRPHVDGIGGSGAGAMSAGVLFSSLANDMFNMQPHKVVFGMCISDCSGTGSNTNAAQAVKIMSDLRTYSSGQYSCNGGAFFWVAAHDTGGAWSDVVVAEVKKTAGCSAGPSTTAMPSSSTVTASPTLIPTMIPTSKPSSVPTSVPSTTPTSIPSLTPTASPTPLPTIMPTTSELSSVPMSSLPSTTQTSIPSLTPTTQKPSANPTLTPTMSTPIRSPALTSQPTSSKPSTWTPTSLKPTSSKPTTMKPSTRMPTSSKPTYLKPTSKTPTSKTSLKPTLLKPTTTTNQCGPTKTCESIGYPGYCCSQYGWCGLVDVSAPDGGAYCGAGCQNGPCFSALVAPSPPVTSKPTSSMPTGRPTLKPVVVASLPTALPPTFITSGLVISTTSRCGTTEVDARENCRSTCTDDSTCQSGMKCHSVHENYCGSIPQRTYTNPLVSPVSFRCGLTEIDARTFCGIACTYDFQCTSGGHCTGVHPNYCGSAYTETGLF